MSVDLKPKVLLSPHDDSGGGGKSGAPTEKADGDELAASDSYSDDSGSTTTAAPAFKLPLARPATAPRAKRLSRRQMSDRLLTAAEGLKINDPTGIRRDEAKQIFPRALDYLVANFKPEKTANGKPPNQILVRRALRSAYRTVHPGKKVDRNDAQIEHLIEPFSKLITNIDLIFTLGLKGTKLKVERSSSVKRKPKKTSKDLSEFAARIINARELFSEIRAIWTKFPSINVDPSITEEIIELHVEAGKLSESLDRLGESKTDVEKALFESDEAQRAIANAGRLEEIAALMRYHFAAATTQIDRARVDYFSGFVQADMQVWLEENADGLGDHLKKILDLYIGLWLSEQAGDTPPGIRYSETALANAVAGVKRNIDDAEAAKKFDSASRRMMSYLIRRESIRSRLISAAASRGEAVGALPIARHIASREQFAEAIGSNLYANFNEFFVEIQDAKDIPGDSRAKRAARANAFYELFVHYVRYAANVYGDHFSADLMRENGLEAQLVRAIYSRVENAHAYGEEPIELLRQFFAKYITDKDVPAVEELMPMSGMSGAARMEVELSGGPRFAIYDDDMTMQQYLEQMPFHTVAAFRSEFESRVGYSFDAFRRWGSIRRRPSNKTQEEWEAEVELATQRNYLEDVTQQPRTQTALDAILPAFWFLNEKAAQYGMSIDVWDYLAAIYPVIRRMRTTATDGVISIAVPSFMRSLPFRNWGYPTWAQQVVQNDLATDVVRSTLYKHARGEVEQPEYWDLRRYAIPMADGTGGGPEQQHLIYEFVAGMIRVAHIIDNAAQVFDSGSGLVTFAPEGMPTRFIAQLEDDPALYLSGRIGPTAGAQRALFLDVRRGVYDEKLSTIRDYLEQIRYLPMDLELTWADGIPADPDEIHKRYLALKGSHLYYKALLADRSATSSTRSAEDLKEISDFYAILNKFYEKVLFVLRVRGSMDSRIEPIEFDTSVRLADHEYNAEKWGRTTLFLNDAFEAAKRHSWSDERLDDLLKIKVYVGKATVAGNLSKQDALDTTVVAHATERYWSGNEEEHARAVQDFVTVEKEHRELTEKESVSDVRDVAPRQPAPRIREPILPTRRLADGWTDQWREFANAQGMGTETVELAMSVITAYFGAVRSLYSRFWAGIFEDIVNDRTQSLSGDERIRMVEAISKFFPTIGVANGETKRVKTIDEGDEINAVLAQWAAEDYVDAYPQSKERDTQVPIDNDLLRDFVNLYCLDYRGKFPQPSMVILQARQILEEYNSHRKPSTISIAGRNAQLAREGLMNVRLLDHVDGLDLTDADMIALRDAYMTLYDDMRRGQPIEEARVQETLQRSGTEKIGRLTPVLFGFIGMQMSDLSSWRSLVADPKLGFAAYVREQFQAEYITDAGLTAFANEYVGDRLTLEMPADPNGISATIVDDAFSPHSAISNKMAKFYRILFNMWIEKTSERLEDRLGYMRLSLEEIADDDVAPATSPLELVRDAEEQTAETLREETFDSISSDGNMRTIRYLTGAKQREGIDELAQTLFETKTLPATQRRDAQMADLIKAARNEIEEILGFAQQALTQSMQLYSGWNEPVDVSSMSMRGLMEFISEADHDAEAIAELGQKLDSSRDFPERLRHLHREFGNAVSLSESMVKGAREILDDARNNIESATRALGDAKASAQKRLNTLKSEEETKRLAEDANTARSLVKDTVDAMKAAMESHQQNEEAAVKLNSRATDLANRLSEPTGNMNAFFGIAMTQGDELAKEAGELSADIEASEKRIAELLGESTPSTEHLEVKTIAEAIDIINESEAFVSEDEVEEQLEILEQLEDVQISSQAILASVEPTQNRVHSLLEGISAAFSKAEENMPIGKASGIPNSQAANDSKSENSFSSATPKGNPHIKSQKHLGPIANGRVLTVHDESYLLTASEYSRIQIWLKENRSSEFTTKDAFGNPIVLKAAERGIKVSTFSQLPKGHPFKNMMGTLSLAISESSPEAQLLSYLGKPTHHGLLFELLGYLAKANPSSDIDGARETLKSWYLGNATRLIDEIGPPAAKLFAMPHDMNGVDYAKDNVPSDFADYTEENHLARKRRFGRTLAHPELGRMIVEHMDDQENLLDTSVFYVDIDKAKNVIAGKGSEFEVFIAERNGYQKVNIRRLAAGTQHKISLESERISEQKHRVDNLRMLHRIYSDPKLMALGWLIAVNTTLPEGVAIFINQALSSISNTPFGRKPSVTFFEIQDAAVNAYIDMTITDNAFPELGRVKLERIDSYIDTYTKADLNALLNLTQEQRDGIIAAGEKAKARMRTDAKYRRLLAKAYLISMKMLDTGNERLIQESWRDFKLASGIIQRDARESIENIDERYKNLRAKMIADPKLIQKATGLHAAYQQMGYVRQDDKLAAVHPETAMVGAAQMKKAYKTLQLKGVGAKIGGIELSEEWRAYAYTLIRAMDIFPEFAGALTIIGMLFDKLPIGLRQKLTSLIEEYNSASGVHSEETVEVFRQRFQNLYNKFSGMIRAALQGRMKDGATLAYFLTGVDDPWNDHSVWDNSTAAERLFALAPEFSKVLDHRMETFFGSLSEKASDGRLSEGEQNYMAAFYSFAKAHPELGGAVAMLITCLKHFEGTSIGTALDNFFDNGVGAWHDPAAAAKLIGRDGSEIPPEQLFASIVGSNTIDIRKALQRPIQSMPNETVAHWYTGQMEPWNYDSFDDGTVEQAYMQRLPLMDYALVMGMNLSELINLIESRLSKLHLLPATGEKLDAFIDVWADKQQTLLKAGNPGIADADKMPKTLGKMMLAIERADFLLKKKDEDKLSTQATKLVATTPFVSQAATLRHVFTFMIEHRAEITEATRKAVGVTGIMVNGKTIKKGGGNDGTPPTPGSANGSSTPPATPSATSNETAPSQGATTKRFDEIAYRSGNYTFVPEAHDPSLADETHLAILGGEEFMDSAMTATTTSTIAAPIAMGMAF